METDTPKDSSLGGEIVAGMLGAAVSMGCCLIPLVHIIAVPLGPFVGGVVAGNRVTGFRGRFVIGLTVGTAICGLISGVLAIAVHVATVSELPSWFPFSPSARAVVAAIVWTYATILSTVGASLSGSFGKKKKTGDEAAA